jgi:non-canonical purine NTP pyrophosphatase (RdgB/HAM1 family)
VGRVTARLASGNLHKLRELRELFPDWEIEPLGADMPEETGATFDENARAKALLARELTEPGVVVVAEDSGLEVDGLGGRPGIRSARYASEAATDEENVARLLEELSGMGAEEWGARYVSELVALLPDGTELRGTGTLEGRIAEAPRGSGGFGYDPVFVPAGESRTVAELGDEWKREHSHRARAAAALRSALGGSSPEL